jgi:DNA primase
MMTIASHRRLSVDDVFRACVLRGVPVRRAGRGYSTHCPAHDDRRASLSFVEGEDGSALIFCHAGCATHDVVRALSVDGSAPLLDPAEVARRRAALDADRRAREARARERYERSLRHPDRVAALRHVSKPLRWDAGDLLERGVGWFDGRIVFPSAVDDAVVGTNEYAAPGTRARLADHPKMIAYGARTLWPAPTSDVELLVEGAPAAATLLGCGFAACGFPSAVFRRRDAEQLAAASARSVLVLADADEAGRRGARTAVLILRELGIGARAIDVSPLADDGRDVADEIRARDDGAGWLRAELAEFIGPALATEVEA